MLLLGAGFSLTAPSAPNVKIWALDKAHYVFRGSNADHFMCNHFKGQQALGM
jgi:hypothetical protein